MTVGAQPLEAGKPRRMTRTQFSKRLGQVERLCPVDRRVDPGLVADLLDVCRVGAFPCGACSASHSFIQTTFFSENYTQPLSDPVFQRYLTNSLIVASLQRAAGFRAGRLRNLRAFPLAVAG